MRPTPLPPLLAVLVLAFASTAFGAASPSAAGKPAAIEKPDAVGKEDAIEKEDDATYRQLQEAAGAVVAVHARALLNARSNESLGSERSGSGIVIAPSGLVLTIGYLILEADQVEVTDANGRSLPASVVAYDHATGFGLLRTIGPISPKPVRLGNSGSVEQLDRLMIATGGEGGVSIATVVSRRPFAGYWEYLIDGAIFTAPPRMDHSGAALINKDGELVGIGSLFVMDAMKPGERLPGNMFVPIDLLKPILAEMIETGRQKAGRRPWIGVSSAEDDGRLKVLRVTTDGPADKAGIHPGDIILAVGGEKVRDLPDFYHKLWASGEPGVEVGLSVLQGADLKELRVRSIDRLEFLRRKPTI
ncbi:MAG TPA: S1C family serine protease [Usitatibacteraceae bacterium]|nr:S1C family serine protease [Usitatibacteraceae bacterium]